jgi:hypothetical protein
VNKNADYFLKNLSLRSDGIAKGTEVAWQTAKKF